ncbi:unnamed protein product [Darwinula stevensoni]|uniref:Uncharacterized protein n=1 Tax=Darwinula stevensoni TaxID=69355 RepID=A0A7R8XE17_9CRUS|nr:unnamed protein product [Darwinula stevensoni]CAG0895360.1 unnamed protein product [Darwinula stevensoni]
MSLCDSPQWNYHRGQLPEWEVLDLSYERCSYRFSHVPAFKSDSLEVLVLYDNHITGVKFEGSATPKLRELYIEKTWLAFFPTIKSDNLEILNLGNNRIRTVKSDLRAIPKLRELHLQKNMLTFVPACKSESLEVLDLNDNRINRIEFDGWATPKLRQLLLNNNFLTSLLDYNSASLVAGFPASNFKERNSLGPHTKVYLRNNSISTLDRGILQRIMMDISRGDGFLHLEYNPIKCDCGLACSQDETECIQVGKYLIGTKVNYICDGYYILRGPRVRTCGVNGEWTGPDPFCEPECGRMEKLVASPQKLIRGGEEAALGAWPWQAAIYDVQFKDVICGGALIGKQWVLTAAHCVMDPENASAVQDVNNFFVYLGMHYRDVSMDDEVVQKMKVTQIIPKAEYTGWESDIALIKLDDSANLTERVQLICLPSNENLSDEFLDGAQDEFGRPDRGWVAGWGKDVSNQATDVLTQVQLEVIPKPECRREINVKSDKHPTSITTNTFCAGKRYNASSLVHEDAKEYKTVCPGDSGSPMVFASHSLLKSQWVVEGIVSHIYTKSGRDCSNYEPGEYGVFARVNNPSTPPSAAIATARKQPAPAPASAHPRKQPTPIAPILYAPDISTGPFSSLFNPRAWDRIPPTSLQPRNNGPALQPSPPASQPVDITSLSTDNVSLQKQSGADLGSDHLPIHVTLDICAPSRSNFVREVYDFKNADWGEFHEIQDSLLPDTLALETPSLLDDSATIVAEAIFIAQDLAVPKVARRLGRLYSISTATLKKIRERRGLRRIYHRHGYPELRTIINGLNKEIKELLALDQETYWDTYCSNLNQETDPKDFWKLFQRVGKPSSATTKPPKIGTRVVITDEGKAEVFGESLASAMTTPSRLQSQLSPKGLSTG